MIGKRLKRARVAAGMSMVALGRRVGVSGYMIRKYEHDERMPDSVVYRKLRQELGVPRGYLMRPVELELRDIRYCKPSSVPK